MKVLSSKLYKAFSISTCGVAISSAPLSPKANKTVISLLCPYIKWCFFKY